MSQNRIESHFSQAAEDGRKSLILFLSAGFPSLAMTEDLILAIDEAGCDVLELGVPFSDPIADGPTIQASSEQALKAGATLEKILDLVERVRERCEIPILLFGAFNPFLHYGLEKVVERAAQVGVDGLMVPDLPIEECSELEKICADKNLALIQFVARTTPPERMKAIAKHASGFIYFFSLKGVTGVEITIDADMSDQVRTLKKLAAPLPVAIGFGVQTAEHVRQTAKLADGVVVGSALIRLIDEHREAADLLDRVRNYTRELKAAL